MNYRRSMVEKALSDIRALYDGGVSRTGHGGCVRKEDVLLWARESNLSITATFDHVGIDLARAYANGSLDWDFCDSAANDLFRVLVEFDTDSAFEVEEPSQFWKFYLAFDHSETVEAQRSEEVARLAINQFLSEIPAET